MKTLRHVNKPTGYNGIGLVMVTWTLSLRRALAMQFESPVELPASARP